MTKGKEQLCERNLIAAYVDGELDQSVAQIFEEHVESCDSCRAELRAHRLFVCELDAVMTGNDEVPVPADFSRMVAARASTDMRGVRTRHERRKALSFCIILALAAFALLGATARDVVFTVTGKFVTTFFGVAGVVATVIYDAVAGLAVIFRVLSRKFIIESGSLGPLLVLLALAILVLSRLISNYHRTGATE